MGNQTTSTDRTPGGADAAVRVRGLRKIYTGKPAVDGIDLDISRGECFALLGPNGAGKTTTVEILEGYRKRDGGEVDVLGTDPASGGLDWRARLGIVLQTSAESAELTVEEMLRHFARYYADPRGVDEVIAAVGLQDKRHSRMRHLSGGQRRRLDVGLGIIGRPELLFLDEPTTGFDPQARRAFWDLIDGLRDGGTTILLTTHYLDEAEFLADRVAIIAAGQILAVDTPANLGGRQAHIARVRWQGTDGRHEQATQTPTALVTELAARFGGEVPGLQVVRPSLEDVYLSMIHDAAGGAETTFAGLSGSTR